MKQLGNLAVVCARRKNILMKIINGCVAVYVGANSEGPVMQAPWDDDKKISAMIHELNFGKYKEVLQ